LQKLIEFADAVECPRATLLDHLNETRPRNHPETEIFDDLPQSRFEEAMNALRTWEANRGAANE
jgi:hypothetical protein